MGECYVIKKEVDWSLLHDGLTIPMHDQVIFKRNMGKFLEKGQSKEIHIIFNGKTYDAKIVNVNFDSNKFKRNEVIQLRYSRNSDLAKMMRVKYQKSYEYFIQEREIRKEKKGRSQIKLPEEQKEYLAIYATEFEDTYLFESIVYDELDIIKRDLAGQSEQVFEESINYDVVDKNATILLDERLVKIRKLNRSIGNNLKQLYNYHCQICGEAVGSQYNVSVVEAHHIDYYVKSLNNDEANQLVVCPNHHRIIHKTNPIFDREKKIYIYENGFVEGLKLNKHL